MGEVRAAGQCKIFEPTARSNRNGEKPTAVVMMVEQKEVSMNADLGPSWTKRSGYNLLSEYQLLRYGISVLKVASKNGLQLYLQDIKGRKFPIDSTGNQFRIRARTYLTDGTFAEADFILDGGAFGHVLSAKDAAAMGGGRGTECVSVGSFSPRAREELVGGASWFTNFCDEKGEWRAPATKISAASSDHVD